MNADQRGLKHGELTERIIGVFYEVYNELGPDFLESVYEEAMAIALTQAGMAGGSSILVYSARNEQGFAVDFWGDPSRSVVNMEVLLLVLLGHKISRAVDLAGPVVS